MKIAYFNYLYDMKYSSVGAAAHVKQITTALRYSGNQVFQYNLNRYQSIEASVESPARALLKEKMSYYLRQPNAVRANIRYFIKEWHIVNKDRPDVLLVRYNLLNFSFALAAKLKNIPLVLELNAPLSYESREFARDVFHLPVIPEFIEKLSLYWADKIIVVSQELKNYYVDWGIHPDKIFVVPNGADEQNFNPTLSGEEIKAKYNFSEKKIVGFVGSFHYWHGINNIMDLIESIISQDKDVAFMLIGRGPLKDKLQKIVKEKKLDERIVFPGYIPHEQVPRYVAVMDIVLAPYPNMDFFYFSPLKVFEYMAMGKAVVATKIGQIKEIIDDGNNGMLFEPGDLDEMQQKVTVLLNDDELRKKIGTNARKTIEQNYTWQKTAEKVHHVLQAAITSKTKFTTKAVSNNFLI